MILYLLKINTKHKFALEIHNENNMQKGIWCVVNNLDCDFGILVDENSLPQDLKTLKWEDSPDIMQEIKKLIKK